MEPGLRPPRMREDAGGFVVTDDNGEEVRHERFAHAPLTGPRTIRLIKLVSVRPSTWNDPQANKNVFELLERPLDQPGLRYATLSYAWGSNFKDCPLPLVDGSSTKILPITMNAWEAVNLFVPALAPPGQDPTYLWVDQICINQDERSEEKAVQVSMMSDVYRKAEFCLIWLGSEDEDTATAFQFLSTLEARFPVEHRTDIPESDFWAMSHQRVRERITELYQRDLLPPESDPGWPAFTRLLHRPWFTRLWTCQEAVLSYEGGADPLVCCGRCKTLLTTVLRASMFLGSETTTFGVPRALARIALQYVSLFQFQVRHKRVTPISWLLQLNDFYECTRPDDRVYALLGMQKEDPEMDYIEDIRVNYTKPTPVLYTEVARSIIRSQRSLRLCADAPERTLDGVDLSLPSWVPNWTARPLTVPFDLLNPNQAFFKASRHRPHEYIPSNGGSLWSRGKIVDTIAEILDNVTIPHGMDETQRGSVLIGDVVPRLQAALQRYSRSWQTSSQLHTIVKTITLDGYTRHASTGHFGLPKAAWSEECCVYMLKTRSEESAASDPSPPVDPRAWLAALATQAIACVDRKFALLQNSGLALVPSKAMEGDNIAILHGSSLPFILRSAMGSSYSLVGVCFVDGMMRGEQTTWREQDANRIEIS